MARVGYRERTGAWRPIFRVHAWSIPETGELTADVQSINSSQGSGGWLPVRKSGFYFAETPGEWIGVEMEVLLNTPHEQDGAYRIWVNDELVIEATNIDLRGAYADRINEVMFDGYWNGGSTHSANRYFDNIVISTKKIGLRQRSADKSRPSPPFKFRGD
jgi:hypothetical protein